MSFCAPFQTGRAMHSARIAGIAARMISRIICSMRTRRWFVRMTASSKCIAPHFTTWKRLL